MYVNFSSSENHTESCDKTKTNEWLAFLIKIKGRIKDRNFVEWYCSNL